MLRNHLTRGRLGLVLTVMAGAVFGAVFGQPGSSRAAGTAVPKKTKPPAISGAALVGDTLVATRGTWSGGPASFPLSWGRGDAARAARLANGGAAAENLTPS